MQHVISTNFMNYIVFILCTLRRFVIFFISKHRLKYWLLFMRHTLFFICFSSFFLSQQPVLICCKICTYQLYRWVRETSCTVHYAVSQIFRMTATQQKQFRAHESTYTSHAGIAECLNTKSGCLQSQHKHTNPNGHRPQPTLTHVLALQH